MDSYLQTVIEVAPKLNTGAYKRIEDEMNRLGKLDIFGKENLDNFIKARKEFQALSDKAKELRQGLKAIEDITGAEAESARRDLQDKLKTIEDELSRRGGRFESIDSQSEKSAKTSGRNVAETLMSAGTTLGNFGRQFEMSTSTFGKFIGDFSSGIGTVMEDISSLLSAENTKQRQAALSHILDSALSALGKLLNDSFSELENILDFSKLSNETTRELMFGYGFSSSQAYGYSKAMSVLGFGSEEDLWYSTDQEKSQFIEAFIRYTEKYNELYDSGMFEKMQEYNVEMAEFKEDLKLEVVEFFMDNKDVIKSAMEALIHISEGIIKIIAQLADIAGGPKEDRTMSQRLSDQAAILNNYSNLKTTNISIDNTFNNVAKEDQGWLANAGQLVYEPVVKAFQ